jgi:hypothetical protein
LQNISFEFPDSTYGHSNSQDWSVFFRHSLWSSKFKDFANLGRFNLQNQNMTCKKFQHWIHILLQLQIQKIFSQHGISLKSWSHIKLCPYLLLKTQLHHMSSLIFGT